MDVTSPQRFPGGKVAPQHPGNSFFATTTCVALNSGVVSTFGNTRSSSEEVPCVVADSLVGEDRVPQGSPRFRSVAQRQRHQPQRHLHCDVACRSANSREQSRRRSRRARCDRQHALGRGRGRAEELSRRHRRQGRIEALSLLVARDLVEHGVRSGAQAHPPLSTRMGLPTEFAMLVRHIIENSYLNGSILRLDGGARLPA